MTKKDANVLKARILSCRTNELTKKISIQRVFSLIDNMVEPDKPHIEMTKILCPKCGIVADGWRMKL